MSDLIPRWSVRLDASRATNNFSDLISIVNHHFGVHQAMDEFLGPYNAQQRSSKYPYQAPDKEALKGIIQQNGMNDFSYSAYLNSVIKFCEQHKGQRALPAPHPSIIHSIQLPLPAFELEGEQGGETEVHVAGAEEPLRVKGLRDADTVKFIIVRPKLSQLGTASVKNWEVLFYRHPIGYIPDWVDSQLNPRYSGCF